METTKHGSESCNWYIPKDFLNRRSVVYSFGAGEDIQFEVDLANTYGCSVEIFDPTPRSLSHYIDRHLRYKIENDNLLTLNTQAVSDFNGTAKFYFPANPEHVSCSLEKNNGQCIEVNVRKLSTLMKIRGDKAIDLLKLDIEGTEYKVLKQLVEENIPIKCICVEFHNGHADIPGYQKIKTDGHNVTFIKKEI